MATVQRMDANHQREDIATQSARAREIMEKRIETGRARAAAVFERVNSNAPVDAIAKGAALRFGSLQGLRVKLGNSDAMPINKHALGQFASRAGIPGAYLADLAATEGWQRTLAADLLTRHYHEGSPGSRFLVRKVGGEVRGFLSDKYRRLDSRPLIDAFAQECQKIGAVPVDGTCSDTRVAMKAILPKLFEPVPGEVLVFGLEWGNSDFGNGTHSIRAFIERLWCLNGAVMQNALAQVHLGRTLSDDIELSQRTYELDTAASISALRDVVAGTLSEQSLKALCDGIAAADAKEIEWRNVSGKLARQLLKGELEEARKMFEGDDVVNLPAGKSVWRASNAVSWLAGKAEDADRKLELQRIAGQIIHGKSEAAELVN